MSWVERSLDELGFVSRGKSRHRPRDAAHLYDGPYPFVQTGDVKHAGLYLTEFTQTYSEAGLAQSKLWPKGTLCITIAANIADTSILDIEACFPDSVIGFIPDPDKADARFIKYLFDAKLKLAYQQFTQGAAQDNLSQGKLLSIRFPVPEDVKEQTRIADVAARYDDLIENNRRRIRLLEESARLLYKEWFVQLRFPGHEHVKIIDGVPEGWGKFTIRELADIYRGKSYKSSELREDGGLPFVNLKCIQRYGGFRSDGIKRFEGVHKETHIVNAGEIVIAVTDMTREAMIVSQAALVPKLVSGKAVFSMDLVKAIPKEGINKYWFYSLLRYSSFSLEVREHATGTNVLHLKPKYIEGWNAVVPSPSIRKIFDDYVSSIFDQIDQLGLQTEALTKARNLLLPRLMNGDLVA